MPENPSEMPEVRARDTQETGCTTVLLPGLLCDDAVWEPQRRALAAAGCVVPDYELTDSIAGMARKVLDEVDAPLLAVAGHSMGGRVALDMARQAPSRIAGLALLDTGFQARPAGPHGDAEKRERLALLELAHARGMRDMGRQWAQGMVHPAHLDAPVFEDILSMIARKTPAVFEAQIRALLDRPNATPVLQSLRCPVMILCGRQDTWSPLARHVEMQKMVVGADLVAIEDAGHMTTMERPEPVNAALLRWLGALAPCPGASRPSTRAPGGKITPV